MLLLVLANVQSHGFRDIRIIPEDEHLFDRDLQELKQELTAKCISNNRRNWLPHVRAFLRDKYQIDLPNIVIEQPPKVEMGEFALPLSFELAKRLRKAPRKIAEEIVAELPLPEGFEKLEVAGAGYINARLKRDVAAKTLARAASHQHRRATKAKAPPTSAARFWWSTPASIPTRRRTSGICATPSSATRFVRLLRAAGHTVDVQNYIDNTGVQVADVVVGFLQLEKKSKQEIAELIASTPRFDYYCWDLYARVSQWYEQDKEHLKARSNALHAIEQRRQRAWPKSRR